MTNYGTMGVTDNYPDMTIFYRDHPHVNTNGLASGDTNQLRFLEWSGLVRMKLRLLMESY